MVSEAQKTSGYILPDPIAGYDLICVRMKIPNVGEYRQAFYSQIFQMVRFWTWEKSGVSGDTRASQAGKYWQGLIEQHYQLGECDLILRQNPTEPCLLEQSLDGGETWSLAFDYSICMTSDPAMKFLVKFQVGIQSGDWQGDYDAGGDNIGAVFPDVVYDSSPEDFDRDTALCYALHGYVIGICEASAETIEANQAIMDNVAYALGLAAGATGLWAGFGLTFWIPLGLALGALGASIASEALGNEAEQYRDETAQEQVICYMYNQLKGATVQASDFLGALTGETFTGNAEKIADAVAVTLNDITAYLAFMNIVSEGFTLAQQGLIQNECGECDSEWCWDIDATVTQGGLDLQGWGTWVNGVGWKPTADTTGGNNINRVFLGKDFSGVLYNFTSVRMYYTATVLQNDVPEYSVIDLVDTITPDADGVAELGASQSTGHYLEWTGNFNADQIFFRAVAGSETGTDPIDNPGDCTVTRIVMMGNGTNPFGSDNC